jgi:drug/metabolite transporter (DMT)-like permease
MRATEAAMTLGSVALIGSGQILFKLAARDVALAGFTWKSVASWASPAMVGALAVSTLATALWIWVLRSASLGLVYPLYALTFVLVPVLDAICFGATLTPRHWLGAAAIVGGVWLMSGAGA